MAFTNLLSLQSSASPSSIAEKEGYDVKFKLPMNAEFTCGLCKFALRWPQQATCGCRFCKGCIQRYAERTGSEFLCPNCNEEDIHIDQMNPDHFARKKIDNAIVLCPNKSKGCKEQFILKELKSHIEQCAFQTVECIHKERGCAAKMSRNDLMNHLKIDCSFRVLKCQHCAEEISMQERKDHLKLCKMQPMECPNGCGNTEIIGHKLEEHLKNECPKQVIKCQYASSGCNFKGFAEDMKVHLTDNMENHLQLMAKFSVQLELKNAESFRLLTDQQSKTDILERKHDDITAEVAVLKDKTTKYSIQIQNLQKMLASHRDIHNNFDEKLRMAADKDDVTEMKSLLSSQQEQFTTIKEDMTILQEFSFVGSSGASNISASQLNNFHGRISSLDKDISLHSIRLAEQDLRFQVLETASYDGVLVWKIKDFTRRKRDADSGKTLSLYSQPFYTSRFGYKMCARVYLNGDGMGKKSHVSLFFVVMKSDYDALLPWPFRQKVTLMLLDQDTGRRHLSDSFRPDPVSSSFKRPSNDMNIASGCPLFVAQNVLQDGVYVKDDTIFFKIIVDVADLFV